MARMLIAALVIAGWLMVYISARRGMKRACADLRLEFQRQIDSLSENIRVLERRAGARAAPDFSFVPAGGMESLAANAVPADAQAQAAMAKASAEISSETLAAITETITGLVGRKVRIRSVKRLQTPDAVVSTWAQQGRVVVQASHNLAQRGHEK